MAVRRILTSIAMTAIGLAAPCETLASPRSDPATGRAVFTGSTLAHPTSLTLNPAALSIEKTRNQFYLAFLGALHSTTVDPQTFDLDTGTYTPGERVSDLQLGPGGQIALLGRRGDRLAIGGELRVPPSEMQLANHQALRYSTLGGGQRSYIATAGVSVKLTGRVHVGASLSHEFTTLRLRYARDTALENGYGPKGIHSDCGGAPCGLGNPLASETYDVDVRSNPVSARNLRLNLGVAVRLANDVWLGLAYHTPPGLDVQTTLDGSMAVTMSPRDGGNTVNGRGTVYVSYPASVDGELRARIRNGLDLHVGGRWEDLSRFSMYDVRGVGSTFRNAGVAEWMPRARGLQDAFSLWAGVEQHDTGDQMLVGARLGFETASVEARRTSPLTIAPAALTLDVGAQGRIVHGAPWSVQLSYGIAVSPSVTVGRDATFNPVHRLDCIDSNYDYTSAGCEATREGYATSLGAGEYKRTSHSLRVGFLYEW
jgi:long-subunit fatty acid transport protein